MPSRLTDGLPITTEWLNSLVEAINSLSAKDASGDAIRPVSYSGTFVTASTPLQIEAGEYKATTVAGNDTAEFNVNFKVPFSDNNVIVTATPDSINSTGARANKPAKAYVAVGNVTKSGFQLALSLEDDSTTYASGKEVRINYIAIGKRA